MISPSRASSIAIIGGGPAGLMAAEQLASQGSLVTVYDRMPSVGRKFLMAGRGGLNITHSEPIEAFIERYGSACSWLAPTIRSFPPQALRDWCLSLGQETFVGSSRRVFPKALKASPLLRAWLQRLDQLGVRFALRHSWYGWDENGKLLFHNSSGDTIKVCADVTILALGGASWPRLGSDGAWVDILRSQGIDVRTLRPSNCGFRVWWSPQFRERFAGHPIKPLKLSFADKVIQGEAMITQTGLEGSAIYALSSALRQSIETKGEAVLKLDVRPGLSRDDIILRLHKPRGSQSTSNYLRKAVGLSPVAIGLMRESRSNGTLPTDSTGLAALIKETHIKLTEPAPLARAISSAGGVSADEVDASFMLKKMPGVYVVGEMLDWEAPTGGYLLQACFSTAVTAADNVRDSLKSASA